MRLFQKFVIGFILLFGSSAINAQQPKFEIVQPEIFAQRSSMTHAWADYNLVRLDRASDYESEGRRFGSDLPD